MRTALPLLIRRPRPGPVVLASLAITLLFVARLVDFEQGRAGLRVDPSTEVLLPEGDEFRAFEQRMSRLFGTQETLVLALVVDDVFSAEALLAVRDVTEALERAEGVERVVSLANAPNLRGFDGEIQIAPFLDEIPRDPDALARLRRELFENPVYAGNLVSRDGRATALVVYLQPIPEQEFIDREIDRRIAETARRASGNAAVWIAGPSYVKAETSRLILRSLARIVPLCFAIMVGIGLVAFRSVGGVVVPIATVLMALVWTLGTVAWLGLALNLVTTVIPPLLISIGFAYTVHVVSEYDAALRERPDAAGQAASRTLQVVALPTALAGLTTAAGFLSLTLSPFPAVKQFGWIAVLGVSVTVLLALGFAPAALELLAGRAAPRRAGPAAERLFEQRLERLARFDLRHRWLLLGVSALLVGASLWGMTRIRVNTDLVSNFEPDHPVRVHFAAVNEHLQGATPLDVVIEAARAGDLADPANLAAVADLQAWLAAQPEVGGSTSIVDYLKLLNRAFHDGDPSFLAIPAHPRLTHQLLLFGAGDETSRYLDSTRRTARIQVRSSAADSGDLAELVRRIEARLAALPDHLHARVTGSTVLVARAVDAVAEAQIVTLSVAFVFVYAILALLFTSLRVGLVALIPNALPVVLYFGALGISGIPLNTTTGLFACIVLGIAVDDTIHMFTRFNAEARRRVDERVGAVHALRAVGRPVTITTLALCLGFLSLTTSELRGQVEFGALGAAILGFAWLVDVTVTPALCAGLRVVTLWEVLTYDLGEDPQRSIPLLSGLSKAQARIAALMTSVERFPAGARIFRTGEPGDDLYVVVDGEMLVSVEREGRRIELARARRGDVVGEIGLYRGARSADVDAVTDLRVLRLTRENLTRLRKRYPRIAARLLWNVSEILADRLQRLTHRVA